MKTSTTEPLPEQQRRGYAWNLKEEKQIETPATSRQGENSYRNPGSPPPMDNRPNREKLSGPTIAFFCQISTITLCSPVLAEAWLPLTAIASSVAGVGFWLWRRDGGSIRPVLLGLLLGATAIAWQEQPTPPLPAALINQPIVLQARIVERQDRADSIQLILDQGVAPTEINPLPAPISIPGAIQMSIHQQPLSAIPGDRIRLHTRLKPVDSLHNPGGFDYGRFLRQQGILARGSTSKPVEQLASATSWSWNRYRQTLSQWIAEQIPEQDRGLVEALMVGKQGLLDSDLTEDLLVSGTYHLVAISGLQLSLVAGWSFFALRLLLALWIPLAGRWDVKPAAAVLTLFPTIAYGFLAGWSVSTQRATLMAILFLLAIALGRTRQLWRILILTAMAILTFQPWQLFAAGFQLSFLSVVGLMFFMPWLQKGSGWRKHLIGLVMTTVVASLVTAPLTAHYFHRFSPHGLLANLLAVPWVSLLSTPLGLLALLAHEAYPPLGDWLLQGMGASLEPYRQGIAWISSLPGAWQRLAGPSLIGLALSLGLCGMAGLLGMAGLRRWRLALALLALPALLWPRTTPPGDQLHLAILDVGQAQSVLLQSPHGGWSVFDAGGFVSPRFNPGEAIISAYLWQQGVSHLNRVVISHPQLDHMAGAEQLLRNFTVDTLWLGDFGAEEQENETYARLIARANRQGVTIQRLRQGLTVEDGDARITVLPPLPEAEARNDNDRSLVVEIQLGKQRFLIPGDATARTEKWLLAQQAIQPLTLLLAPHHGSKTSSTPAFIQASQPQHVVFSVGRYNPHHHPNAQVLKRWRATPAKLWQTDQDGAVIVQSDGQNVQVKAATAARGLLGESLGQLF